MILKEQVGEKLEVDLEFDLSELNKCANKQQEVLQKLCKTQVDLATEMQKYQSLQRQSAGII